MTRLDHVTSADAAELLRGTDLALLPIGATGSSWTSGRSGETEAKIRPVSTIAAAIDPASFVRPASPALIRAPTR